MSCTGIRKLRLNAIFTVEILLYVYMFTLEACKYPHVPFGTGEPTKQGYTVGDTVTFSCISGYNLDGPTTATCNGGNKWTPLPECKPI